MTADPARGWGRRPGHAVSCACLAAASVLLRVVFFDVPMITDEGGYAYVAHFWSEHTLPYRDIPFDRPQGLFLLYRMALALGEEVGAIRLFAALYNALSVVAIYAFTCRLYGAGRAWVGALVFAVFSTAPHIEGFTANAELFTLLPLILSAHLAWECRWWGAGLLAGVATAIKPNGAAGLLLASAWLLANRAGPAAALRLAVGFAAAPLLCIAHGAWIDWDSYSSSFVERRLLRYSLLAGAGGEQVRKLWAGIQASTSSWCAPAVAALFSARTLRDRTTGFCSLWVLSSIAGMALGGEWHMHYFQQWIPPLSVMAAGAAPAVLWPGRGRGRAVGALFWTAALALAVGWFGIREAAYWFRGPKQISWQLYHRPGYIVSDEISRIVSEQTGPTDSIYVAFAEAEIYYLSRRRAAIPQLYFRDVLHSRQVFDRVVEGLRAGSPALVVYVQHPPREWMSPLEFHALLRERYRPLTEVGPILLLKRREGAEGKGASPAPRAPLPTG